MKKHLALGVLVFLVLPVLAADPKPIMISAEDLSKEFVKDDDGSHKKYKDQVFIVTGVVEEANKGAVSDNWFVGLKGVTPPGKLFPKVVQFQFEPKSPFYEQAKKLKKGDKVKMKGVYEFNPAYGIRMKVGSEILKD